LTQSAIAALIVVGFAIFTGTHDPASQAYLQLYGLMAVMGVIIILSVQALVSLAILVYYERYHRDEVHWWKTRLAPALAPVDGAALPLGTAAAALVPAAGPAESPAWGGLPQAASSDRLRASAGSSRDRFVMSLIPAGIRANLVPVLRALIITCMLQPNDARLVA